MRNSAFTLAIFYPSPALTANFRPRAFPETRYNTGVPEKQGAPRPPRGNLGAPGVLAVQPLTSAAPALAAAPRRPAPAGCRGRGTGPPAGSRRTRPGAPRCSPG